MKEKTMHFSLPPTEYRALKILAVVRETNLRHLVRDLVKRELATSTELPKDMRTRG